MLIFSPSAPTPSNTRWYAACWSTSAISSLSSGSGSLPNATPDRFSANVASWLPTASSAPVGDTTTERNILELGRLHHGHLVDDAFAHLDREAQNRFHDRPR